MKIIVYTILFLGLLVLYVRLLEERTVFLPEKGLSLTPKEAGLPFEDVFIETQDKVKIHGWLIKVDDESAPTLIFFHGNAGNISGRIGKLSMFYDLGLNVLIIDYRGYGRSEGKPTEEGMYKDAMAAYDYLLSRKDINHERLIAYGASLGGAAAVDLATQRPLAGLILDSTFSSGLDMGKLIFPFIPSFLIKTELNSVRKIPSIDCPKLFVHSEEDETVPIHLGRKLFDAAKEPKTFLKITGGHNDSSVEDEESFTQAVRDFVKSIS